MNVKVLAGVEARAAAWASMGLCASVTHLVLQEHCPPVESHTTLWTLVPWLLCKKKLDESLCPDEQINWSKYDFGGIKTKIITLFMMSPTFSPSSTKNRKRFCMCPYIHTHHKKHEILKTVNYKYTVPYVTTCVHPRCTHS